VPGSPFVLSTAGAIPLEIQRRDGTSRWATIRLPSLAGALGITACAVEVGYNPNAQLDDLILVLQNGDCRRSCYDRSQQASAAAPATTTDHLTPAARSSVRARATFGVPALRGRFAVRGVGLQSG
jgi:hypothetical protein